jgi:ankyrin repeat protein
LTRFGADLEAVDLDGQSPLHRAASRGRTEVASLLIKVGADVNRKGIFAEMPLHTASYWGHPEFVKLLIARARESMQDVLTVVPRCMMQPARVIALLRNS